jgi:hypothetical protein
MKIKLSSGDWVQLSKGIVYDPDGWDRRAAFFTADWEKLITFEEFMDRCSRSTTDGFNFDEKGVRRNVTKNFKNFL